MNEYEDLLSMPHPVSSKHPQMSVHDRAAQFSPFAALTGYEEVIDETARITEEKHLLDENRWEELQRYFSFLLEMDEEARKQILIEVKFFQSDEKKEGGSYFVEQGFMNKIDWISRRILLSSGKWIPIDDIYDVSFP